MPKASELLALFQHFKRGYAAALHPVEQSYQLTRNELDVLLFLSNNPGFDTARDMVEMRGLTKSHVCKSVDALTRRSFLAARPGPAGPPCTPAQPSSGINSGCECGAGGPASLFPACFFRASQRRNAGSWTG